MGERVSKPRLVLVARWRPQAFISEDQGRQGLGGPTATLLLSCHGYHSPKLRDCS